MGLTPPEPIVIVNKPMHVRALENLKFFSKSTIDACGVHSAEIFNDSTAPIATIAIPAA